MSTKLHYSRITDDIEILPPLCPVPTDPRCTDQPKLLLRAVSLPLLGRHRCRMQDVLEESHVVVSPRAKYYRDGSTLDCVNVGAVAHHSGSSNQPDVAVPKRQRQT